MNKIILHGIINSDIYVGQTRKTQETFAKFRFLVNKTNDRLEIDIIYIGKKAEILIQYSLKGKPLIIEGKLKQDKSSYVIYGEDFYFEIKK